MAAEAAGTSQAGVRRVLLLGGSGRLGGAIAGALSGYERVSLIAPARQNLAAPGPGKTDALEAAASRWFGNWHPDVVINCIAMSDVDRCEGEPDAARQLNAELPGALGRAAPAHVRLIHFSTDSVFDGEPGMASDDGLDPARGDGHHAECRRPYRENDPARPLSVYGCTKLAGELAVTASGCRHWIFRVSWLYGSPSGNLAARLLDPASAGQRISLSVSRIGVPNPVGLLADEIAACVTSDDQARVREAPSGIYHLSCHGFTTWYEFGVEFVREAIAAGRIAAARAPRLEAFDEATFSRPAQRPAWSPLDPHLYQRSFERTMPHWRAAIAMAQESMCARIRGSARRS